MGIPSLFSFLSRNYNNILLKYYPKINNLYFDLNCLIHPQCAKVIQQNPNWTDQSLLEQLMFKQIKDYIVTIINLCNPDKLIYISIDGCAPLAKIKQQRDRRFMSRKEKTFINNTQKEFDIPQKKIWDTNVITPGTKFMDELKNELITFIKKELNTSCKIIFSSADVAGEGEHKILEYIKNNRDTNDIECIYGLDADLIMLSMVTECPEIYLIREKMDSSTNNQNFDIVSISILKSSLIETVCENIMDASKYNENNLIKDFIFYCFILGNDFIPKIQSMKIKDGSITRLISIYSSILNVFERYLIEDDKINTQFLIQMFENLSQLETNILLTYTKYETTHLLKFHGNDPYDEVIYNFANNLPKEKDILLLGETDFKYRYYKEYFNIYYDDEKEYIGNICKEYINSLQWVYQYYFNKCIDWRWCYTYYTSPFISDIYEYMKINKNEINNLSVFNTENKPFSSAQQLLLVLPPQSNNILPKKYQYLQKEDSPIYDIYPETFDEFKHNNRYRWLNIPKLPYLDYKKVINLVKEKYNNENNIIINSK
jgi:5'-3' exonuclease